MTWPSDLAPSTDLQFLDGFVDERVVAGGSMGEDGVNGLGRGEFVSLGDTTMPFWP